LPPTQILHWPFSKHSSCFCVNYCQSFQTSLVAIRLSSALRCVYLQQCCLRLPLPLMAHLYKSEKAFNLQDTCLPCTKKLVIMEYPYPYCDWNIVIIHLEIYGVILWMALSTVLPFTICTQQAAMILLSLNSIHFNGPSSPVKISTQPLVHRRLAILQSASLVLSPVPYLLTCAFSTLPGTLSQNWLILAWYSLTPF
jgi:hypothetical protein